MTCKNLFAFGSALMLSVMGFASASANYTEVFTQAESAGSIGSPFLDTVVVDGGIAYAVNRDLSVTDTGSVVAFDGSSFTEVMSPADWATFGSTNDIAGFLGARVVGGSLRAVNFFDNNIIDVDLGTGAVSEFVSAAAIGGGPNLTASNTVEADGSVYVYDGSADAIINISPAGVVSTVITDAQLSALTGSDILSGTGLALVGDDLYFGSNLADAMFKWDTVAGAGSQVFSEAELEALSDDIDGNAGIDDIFYAPNGLVYFYEDDADYVYSFDPSNPSGTLSVVLTEAYLNDGPGTDFVAQFAWYNGNLAWTDQRDGFYVIPEPASALLGAFAVAGLAVSRRR